MSAAHVTGQPVSPSTYMNHRCRCDECRKVYSEYVKARRSRPGRMRTTMMAGRKAEMMAVKWMRRNEPELWASFMQRARIEVEQHESEVVS